jgi:hypothetical protein
VPSSDAQSAARWRALCECYGARPGSVYLVRPDGHVCGRWHAPSASTVIAALQRACGAERTLP